MTVKIYRPPNEPEAVVIDLGDGSVPAYIPVCADYAYQSLKRLLSNLDNEAAEQKMRPASPESQSR